ncbi:orotate phosphoribosyltransferase [Denitrovibrio acetiphilus DSM 12809]|uniref:Orotate phosphoribosyltransferase n=1 Tax=Denitrovibrio acetiphilus (strain DSM 12809 / NBRC 114555 / N2460) TaxID=522772 RepID=D4H108_DENA2|nr:orotate phosphoribosyltransferase [Denitrovibrio acetiphilus]ADD68671.1 orotate phosphoribosyltransferase [Denitrovibrio acetiphilus DSM 12809]
MLTKEEIIEIYKRHDALLEGHFLLSSGLHSDRFLQSALVMQYPVIAEDVVKELVKQMYDVKFTTVVSPAIGGIRFGYEFARQLKKRSLFTERVNEVMTFKRGFALEKGEKVVVAEDVVTTGKSTRECIDAVKAAGGDVVAVTCLVDRSNGEAQFDVPFFPLVQLSVSVFDPADCPLCKKGLDVVKPGSRNIK